MSIGGPRWDRQDNHPPVCGGRPLHAAGRGAGHRRRPRRGAGRGQRASSTRSPPASKTPKGQRSGLASEVVETSGRVDSLLDRVAEVSTDLATARQAVTDQRARIVTVQETLDMLDGQLAETRDDLAGTLSQAETWARQLYMAGGSDQTLLVLSSTDLADVGVTLEYLSIVSRETDRALLELEALQRQEQRWIAAAERQERILQRQQVALKAEEDGWPSCSRSRSPTSRQPRRSWPGSGAALRCGERDRPLRGRAGGARGRAGPDPRRHQLRGLLGRARWCPPRAGCDRSRAGDLRVSAPGSTRSSATTGCTPGGTCRRAPATPISAAASGRVILAGWFGGYGNCVVVDHGGGVSTLYAHQTSVAVSYGDRCRPATPSATSAPPGCRPGRTCTSRCGSTATRSTRPGTCDMAGKGPNVTTAGGEGGRKVVASNRRARHDYEIVDTLECGIVLTGSEIKSLRAGQIQLKDAYAEIRRGEVWLNNAHIAPYQFARDGGPRPGTSPQAPAPPAGDRPAERQGEGGRASPWSRCRSTSPRVRQGRAGAGQGPPHRRQAGADQGAGAASRDGPGAASVDTPGRTSPARPANGRALPRYGPTPCGQ